MSASGRQFHTQQIHYLRKSITFADNGLTVDVGYLPAGAQILKTLSGAAVNVAFNGGSTNTLDIGPSTDSGTDLWATLLALGTIAFVPFDEVVTLLVSVDTLVQAKVVSTAGASAGSAEIIIAYIPDNDR